MVLDEVPVSGGVRTERVLMEEDVSSGNFVTDSQVTGRNARTAI